MGTMIFRNLCRRASEGWRGQVGSVDVELVDGVVDSVGVRAGRGSEIGKPLLTRRVVKRMMEVMDKDRKKLLYIRLLWDSYVSTD